MKNGIEAGRVLSEFRDLVYKFLNESSLLIVTHVLVTRALVQLRARRHLHAHSFPARRTLGFLTRELVRSPWASVLGGLVDGLLLTFPEV